MGWHLHGAFRELEVVERGHASAERGVILPPWEGAQRVHEEVVLEGRAIGARDRAWVAAHVGRRVDARDDEALTAALEDAIKDGVLEVVERERRRVVVPLDRAEVWLGPESDRRS